MNNSGSRRFNSDGSRNSYIYTSSHVIFDEKLIQDDLNIPLFIIVNIIVFALLAYGLSQMKLPDFKYLDMKAVMIILGIWYFYFMCSELLIRKTGNPWWGAFIPIYNIYLFLKLAFKKPLIGILPYIILYGGIALIIWYLPNTSFAYYTDYIEYGFYGSLNLFPIVYMYNLGTNFNRSGVLMILLWFVLLPTTAFSSMYEYNDGKTIF